MKNIHYVFFLGGHDLEMITIREVLDSNGLNYFDKKAEWGAKISFYNKELENLKPDEIPVFIELYDDIGFMEGKEAGKDYININHHNELAYNHDSSLEQVVELLGEILTSYQYLVAVNDKGHIRAMQRICATEQQISEIREKEYQIQSLTQRDIELSEKAIDNLHELDNIGDWVYIESETHKTALIIDRLWDKHRHIFVSYYVIEDGKKKLKSFGYNGTGAIVDILKTKFEDMKMTPGKDFWYGGELPSYGYFGANYPMTKDDVEEIMARAKGDQYYSHHIFMFPFEIINKNGIFDLNEIEETLTKSKEWVKKPFCISDSLNEENIANYNEMVYFYKFVRESIFDNGKRSLEQSNKEEACRNSESEKKEKPIVPKVRYFERPKDKCHKYYTIQVKNDKEKPTEYKLRISSIHLHIFESHVGILSFDLENYDYPKREDILKINDFGRRIYPQYVGSDGTEATKGSFLADKICLREAENSTDIIENFENTVFLKDNVVLAKHIRHILGESFFSKYEINPVIDDRMYTVCWYANSSFMCDLKQFDSDKNEFGYQSNDDWYKYMFIDGKDMGVANPVLQKKLATEATYDRWIGWGSLIGITRYSLVCLVDEGSFGYDVIRKHMRTMYYQIAVILLMQRASILAFSERVSCISGKIKDYSNSNNEKEQEIILNEIGTFDGDVIHFVNRLWFNEVTAQEQGIEMYEQARTTMKLKEHLADLKSEIQELYDYARLGAEKKSNDLMKKLTILGTVFLPLTLVTGIWGMNVFPVKGDFMFLGFLVGLSTIFTVIVTLVVSRGKKYTIVKVLLYTLLLIILFTLVSFLIGDCVLRNCSFF